MNIKELKEIIKDLPDDMEIKVCDAYWNEWFEVYEISVAEDDEGVYLSIM